MKRMRPGFFAIVLLSLSCATSLRAQTNPAVTAPETADGSAGARVVKIDGIAARIGNDVVTESEVRQLEDYQRLVEGKSQSRKQVLGELIDQWIVRAEAAAAKFPTPSAADVAIELATLAKQFPSAQAFQQRMAQVGLTQQQVTEIVGAQILYLRFINYKFHPAEQVSLSQIENYYKSDLVPALQGRGASVPPLSKVEAQIRELLTQEGINEKAAQWLEEAKSRLKILIQPLGGGG